MKSEILKFEKNIQERSKKRYDPHAQRVAGKSLDLLEHKQLFHYGFVSGEQARS